MAASKQKSKTRRDTLTSPPKLTAGEALKKFASAPPTRFLATGVVRRAWSAAYERAGSPNGVLSPGEVHCLASHYQEALTDEMRRICAQFPADELFFAARMWSPGLMIEHGVSFGESEAKHLAPSGDTLATMAVRRAVVAAALLYGGPVPEDRVTIVGGHVPSDQLGRFVACFVALMNLSYTYLFHAGALRFHLALGHGVDVRNGEMRLLGGDDDDALTFSVDNRRHSYHNFLSRIGEFGEVPPPVLEPYEERGKRELAGGAALYSAWYEPDSRGGPGYRMRAQPLSYVEDVLLEIGRLHPDAAREAWGMSVEEFVALLGGFCVMVGQRLGADWMVRAGGWDVSSMAHGAFLSATLPYFEPEMEGDGKDTLLAHATDYATKKGFDPDGLDLEGARTRFLELALSNGKAEKPDDSPDPKGISLGDGRYAHLMHKFGETYTVDLFHADHWINRPLDLLAGEMRAGEPGRLKGKRVEDAVWDYLGSSPAIKPVEGLRNASLRLLSGANKKTTDIDLPLRFGDTLVLGEVKGKYLGRAPESFSDPASVMKRWEENRELLENADAAARALAARRNDGTFREDMRGIRRVLPVVVRPMPEWIPDLEDAHWLRRPTKTDVGVPRILAPEELKEFLESTSEEEIAGLPGGYVVEVGNS